MRWSFGEKNGEIIIGENNLFTVETLDLSRSPQTLILEKVVIDFSRLTSQSTYNNYT